MKESLFDQIGEEKIRSSIKSFYEKAFKDPMISHFFFGKDINHLIEMQFLFSASMLGSSKYTYSGKPMKKAHTGLPFKTPHFNRRKILLRETLLENNVNKDLVEAWLNLEEKFRPLIVTDSGDCST